MAASDRSLSYGADEGSSNCEGRWSGHLKESIDEENEEDRAGN